MSSGKIGYLLKDFFLTSFGCPQFPKSLTLKSLIDEQGGLVLRITIKRACLFIRNFRVQAENPFGLVNLENVAKHMGDICNI